MNKDMNLRLFTLEREEDESGISGTGTVAVGIIFPNGWCALSWLTGKTSVAIYADIQTLISIHGHNGKTVVQQFLDFDSENVKSLRTNFMQDLCEGVGNDFMSGNHKYIWNERERWKTMFDSKPL